MLNIINNALNYLGEASITSVDEQDDKARKAKQFYDVSRKELLRKQDWGFAQEEIVLNKIPKENYLEFKYVYLYPTNVLFIKKIFGQQCIFKDYKYRVANLDGQKVICCNIDNAKAIITKDVSDTTLFDITFKEALSYLLASKLAMPLTGNMDLFKVALAQYQAALDGATLVNKQEEPTTVRVESDFWKVR